MWNIYKDRTYSGEFLNAFKSYMIHSLSILEFNKRGHNSVKFSFTVKPENGESLNLKQEKYKKTKIRLETNKIKTREVEIH